MKQVQSYIAVLCALLVASPQTFAQAQTSQTQDQTPRLDSEAPHWHSVFTAKYDPKIVPPINVSNTTRIESLLRGGNLYLSLQDAIALALENNIDIEVQRYGFLIADQNLKLAQSGGGAGNVNTAVTGASLSAGAPGAGAGLTNAGGGNTVSTAGGVNTNVIGGGGIPSFDPVLTSTLQWGHTTQPQQNTITTGTTSLITQATTFNFGVSQGFVSGATATLSYNNGITDQNAIRNLFNPVTQSSLDLQFSQPLLQGFGFAINNRNIRIAKNNIKVNDYAFQQQVISTVANVIQLYWNLVSYIEQVGVMQQTLAYSQKLLEDNRKQVEIGTLAPVEVTRAAAEVASDEGNLLIAQTTVRQQEVILKNAISRNGIASPAIAEAHIVPTDKIRVPDIEPVRPMQDLIAEALDRRPDLAQTRVQLENSKISLTGVRDAMRPSLNLIGDVRNNALSGTPNSQETSTAGFTSVPDPFFIGGYGNVLTQLFSRNFPNYSVGAQLNIPLRNRAAQANMAVAQLQLRQSELEVQKSINQIRQDVNNALIAIDQARARYDSAEKSVVLEQQLLDAEQKKLAVGTSTPILVISVQRDLANAELTDVQALTAYGLAKAQLAQALGTILEDNRIQIDEAKTGHVSRPPDPIPDVNRTGNNANGGTAGAAVNLKR
ncbi:MAG TPA: TolC family protein [Bryobacteraceae bacterium]|nr:TolC family protein [Bryobacteraceae bacterium]